MRLAGKVMVVTGAGSGLGQALTLELLYRGARVAAVDLRREGLEATREQAGAKAASLSLHQLDITDRERVEALPQEVVAIHGAVDGLINNAGIIQPFKRLQDLDYATIERVMRVNFYGTLYMIKAFLPLLLARPEAHLVNVSSMGGFLPVPGQTVYGASKAALKLLTEGLWAELQGTPVRVTLVLPGAMRTAIAEHSGVEAPRVGGEARIPILEPAKAAKMLLDGVERDAFRILLGQDARSMDVLYRINPLWATRVIQKRMRHLLS
ncbi:SDR family NAD(P)-dependent oxidoreductase [Thermus antranikianii]|uniref:SDR family NAD(P)-dependent oxidoreductase n=1 Tax=Thermus antranikianii TaxID=88190 RepID=UPI001C782FA1|nr:SDR family oxidoreductase [Thermus antranikianii]QWK21414.1 MAG: SDR family oxidoreductase [Thermus antranikianii]